MDKGLYTNTELIDTIILDLNNLPKALIDGQFIQFCSLVDQMGQKLAILKKGVPTDLESKDKVIEQLKDQLRAAGAEIEDMTPEQFIEKYGKKDGAE